MKVPSPSIDIVSFKSPTVPCQCPTIFVEYSASGTVDELFAQDAKQNPRTTTAIALTKGVQFDFMRSTPFIIYPWDWLWAESLEQSHRSRWFALPSGCDADDLFL